MMSLKYVIFRLKLAELANFASSFSSFLSVSVFFNFLSYNPAQTNTKVRKLYFNSGEANGSARDI